VLDLQEHAIALSDLNAEPSSFPESVASALGGATEPGTPLDPRLTLSCQIAISVAVGQTVTWANGSAVAHTVTADVGTSLSQARRPRRDIHVYTEHSENLRVSLHIPSVNEANADAHVLIA
jgi:hypothetical protein